MDVVKKFSDEDIIYSLRTGEERSEAIRFIYDNYFNSLSWFVINNQGSIEDAEDIFQDVLINFISQVQMNKFRGESSIKTFIFSLNKFSWLNELKRRGKALAREINYEREKENITMDADKLMIEKESTDAVLNLVYELDESCRKILTMFYYQNLSMKEILVKTNYGNDQVVRNKKYKCLKELEKIISSKPALMENLKNLFNE